jgi:hypothetical protein
MQAPRAPNWLAGVLAFNVISHLVDRLLQVRRARKGLERFQVLTHAVGPRFRSNLRIKAQRPENEGKDVVSRSAASG